MRRVIAGFLVSAMLLGECVSVGPVVKRPTSGSVEVRATDVTGAPIEGLLLTFVNVSSENRVTRRLERNNVADIPFGQYWLRITAAGFASQDIPIAVGGGITRVRANLNVSAECSAPFNNVFGRTAPPRNGSERWIKLVSVIGASAYEERVNADGSFKAEGIPYGEYLLLLVEDGKILRSQSVNVRFGSESRVNLQ